MVKEGKKPGREEECDEVTAVIGKWGRWQARMFFIVSLTSITSSWHMLAIAFYAPNADHWCAPPDGLYENWTTDMWRSYSIPPDPEHPEKLSRCLMYDRNYTNVPEYVPEVIVGNFTTMKCQYGWRFNTSVFQETIENEWELVCDREPLAKAGASAYYAGVLVGVVLFGQISDVIGRKKTLMITAIHSFVAALLTAFMPTLESFILTRFLIAMGAIGCYTTSFVVAMEAVDGLWRVVVGILWEVPWCIGYMSLAGVAYILPQWRDCQLFMSVPMVFFCLFWWIVPESPRWLLSQGRREEAYEILRAAAKENGRDTDIESVLSTTSLLHKKLHCPSRKHTLLDLFRTPVLRKRTLNLYFNWFANAFAYFGLSLGIGNLGSSVYLTFFFSGLIELPGYFLIVWILLKQGRRIPHCAMMLLAGASCMATAAFNKGDYPGDWPIVTLAMIGKFGIASSFAIVYLFSAEIYPTVVRNVGVGSSSMCARFGAISAPFVDLTRHVHSAIPLIIYGCVSAVAGLLVLLLPETKNMPLPETVEEVEEYERDRKVRKTLVKAEEISAI